MSIKLTDIKGVTSAINRKFQRIGIRGVQTFLFKCASLKDRRAYAKKIGVSPSKLLSWVNRADLTRVKGVGAQYSDLLEKAGVDTVAELAKRNPKTLYNQLTAVNDRRRVVQVMPSTKAVNHWVSQAKKLNKVVTY